MNKEQVKRIYSEFQGWNSEQAKARVVLGIASVEIAWLLGNPVEIPQRVVETGRQTLARLRDKGSLRDFRLFPLGVDLFIHISAFQEGTADHELLDALQQAVIAVLKEAQKDGPLASQVSDLLSAPKAEQWRRLNLRFFSFPYTERGAEAILVAKLVEGAPGGFNRMLFNLFFHPDKGSHQRLDGTRFVAVVEHLPALATPASNERRVFLFGDRPEEEVLALLYPLAQSPLLVSRQQIGDIAELLSLIANPVEWAISAVYAVRGRFVRDADQWQPTRHEPVAVVGLAAANTESGGVRPACVLRLQSGLPAVGEAHANLGGEPTLTVGGPNNGYHLAVLPVSLADARATRSGRGLCRLAAYSYQSYNNGAIPPPHDVVDLFAQDPVETGWLQAQALELARCMCQHGEFQPFVVAEEAERRAKAQALQLEGCFEPIPKTESGEADPLVQRCRERSGGRTLTDIKADAGGKLGHTAPPTVFVSVAQACLAEAEEKGLLRDGHTFPVGDDLHLLMTHDQGVDANEIHLFAFQTFWRTVWVTQTIGYKPYGLAQDLKIGPATKGKAVEELAQPSQRFLELLRDFLPSPERSHWDRLQASFHRWQQGLSTARITKPFAGNVTGQGPGFAELPLDGGNDFALVAADKAGPAAFNLPLFRAAETALEDPGFRSAYGESIAFEIFDVHAHRRIFLDARCHRPALQALLGATNLFNVKRLWALPGPVEDPRKIRELLGRMLLAASTEKLAVIAGGEYVGKDDPVLLGVRTLVEPIFSLMRDGFYLTQGDERGSHYMMLLPKPLPEAVATVRSRGLEVGLRVFVDSNALISLQDVYAEPAYAEARQRIQDWNTRLWSAQGSEFTPVGVGAHDVEPAYPLMKVLARITGEESPYALRIEARNFSATDR